MAISSLQEIEQKYVKSLIESYRKWEADEFQGYFDGMGYMLLPIIFANDACVILDAGEYRVYIEWGQNECPVYVDVSTPTYSARHPAPEYTRIGKVRNSRFWALVDRFKHR